MECVRLGRARGLRINRGKKGGEDNSRGPTHELTPWKPIPARIASRCRIQSRGAEKSNRSDGGRGRECTRDFPLLRRNNKLAEVLEQSQVKEGLSRPRGQETDSGVLKQNRENTRVGGKGKGPGLDAPRGRLMAEVPARKKGQS